MCSIEDLYKFNQALFSYNIINKNLLEEAFKPMHKDLYKWDNYDLLDPPRPSSSSVARASLVVASAGVALDGVA